MTENHPILSTMAGENSDIYVSQMSKIHLNLSTMIGEHF